MRTPRTIVALILREIGATNGGSALGYLWAVIEPVTAVMILSVLFSLIMRSPPIGHNFPLFYASGILPYIMFVDVSNKVASAVRFSRPLLTFPGVTFIDALLARFVLALLTKLVIYSIVLTLIVVLYDTGAFFRYEYIGLGLLTAMFLAFAVGLINCVLFHFFPVWDRLWSMINRPIVFLSGIIILIEDIPEPYRSWLEWNPLAHVVAVMRMGIYPTYSPGYVSLTYLGIIIALLIPTGLFLMRRFWRDLIDPAG